MVGRTQSTHASRYGRIDDALSILRRAGLLCLARPFVHPCTRLAPASQAREPTRLPYRNVPEFRCHSATHPGGPLLWVRPATTSLWCRSVGPTRHLVASENRPPSPTAASAFDSMNAADDNCVSLMACRVQLRIVSEDAVVVEGDTSRRSEIRGDSRTLLNSRM